MTITNKQRIEKAVNTVHRDTEELCSIKVSTVTIIYDRVIYGYNFEEPIKISRSIERDDLTYKLYTKHDNKPLMTVYGCWPNEFVTDVFIRALEHFYNDY